MNNPVIQRLDDYENMEQLQGKPMSVSGTLNKLFILGLIMLLPAAICWNWVALGQMDKVTMFTWIGAIAGLILGLIISFKPRTAPMLSPLYAVAEGMILGGLSATFEMYFKGIVIQAVAVTFATVFVMITLYKSQIIKVDEKFRSVMLVLIGVVFVTYLTSFIASLFGFNAISNFLWSSSPLSIGVSVLLCIVAALSLLLDFDRIEYFSRINAPEFMDWYCAFGLLVTIVWLYIEVLRLLSKLNRK